MKNFLKKSLPIIFGLLAFAGVAAASILTVPQGGSGVNNITGILQGNGVAPFSTVTIGSGLNYSSGTLSAASTGVVFQTNGINNGSQSLLNLVPGTGIGLSEDGFGNVTIAATGGAGGVSSVTGTLPITVDNTDPANPIVGINQSDASTDGYLSSTDWNTFNNKQNAITIGTLDTATPSPDGLVLSGSTLTAQSASQTNAGLVNTIGQTFAGHKQWMTDISNDASGIPSFGAETTLTDTGTVGQDRQSIFANMDVLGSNSGGQEYGIRNWVTAALGTSNNGIFGAFNKMENNGSVGNGVGAIDLYNSPSTGSATTAIGTQSQVVLNGSSVATNAYGVQAQVLNQGNMGTAYGVSSLISNGGSGNIGAGYNFYAQGNNANAAYAFYDGSNNNISSFNQTQIRSGNQLQFFDVGGNSTTFHASGLGGITNYTLPNAYPASTNYVMTSDPSGTMAWQNPSSIFTGTVSVASPLTGDGSSGLPITMGLSQFHMYAGDSSGVAADQGVKLQFNGKKLTVTDNGGAGGNTFINAGPSSYSGDSNIAIGGEQGSGAGNALQNLTSGNDNLAFGDSAGNTITSEINNVLFGTGADITAGNSWSIALGALAKTTVSHQLMIGTADSDAVTTITAPGFPNTRDDTGTFTPTSFLYPDASGDFLVAPLSTITASIPQLIGSTSGIATGSTPIGSNEVWLGQNAGSGAVNSGTVFIGAGAGANSSETETVAVGDQAGNGAGASGAAVFVGQSAGLNANNSVNSVYLGAQAGANAFNANNSIFIGQGAGQSDAVDNTGGGTSILIGGGSLTGGFQNSIGLGANVLNTAANQFLVAPAYTEVTMGGTGSQLNLSSDLFSTLGGTPGNGAFVGVDTTGVGDILLQGTYNGVANIAAIEANFNAGYVLLGNQTGLLLDETNQNIKMTEDYNSISGSTVFSSQFLSDGSVGEIKTGDISNSKNGVVSDISDSDNAINLSSDSGEGLLLDWADDEYIFGNSSLAGKAFVDILGGQMNLNIGTQLHINDRATNTPIFSVDTSTSQSQLQQGQQVNVTVIGPDTNYTVLTSDYQVDMNPATTSVTVDLPATPTKGDIYVVKDKQQSILNTVTIDGNGNNIDDSSTQVLGSTTEEQSETITFNGTEWDIN